MALNKDRLKNKIKQAFKAEQTEEEDYNASLDRLSEIISQAIIDEIKAITLNYSAGLIAPPNGGAVTGSLNSVKIT